MALPTSQEILKKIRGATTPKVASASTIKPKPQTLPRSKDILASVSSTAKPSSSSSPTPSLTGKSSPLPRSKDILKSQVKPVERTTPFATTKAGIIFNTIIGLPKAVKDLFFPTRGYSEKELREARPSTKQLIMGTPKAVAEFSSNVGNLLGSSPNSLAAKIANTKVGGKLADLGAKIESFGRPKNVEEAAAMRVFDVVSAIPVGSIKVTATGARAIAQTRNLDTIFTILRKEVPALSDNQADVIGRLLTNVDNEDDVQRVLNGLNFATQESGKGRKAIPTQLELPSGRPTPDAPVSKYPRSTDIKQQIGIETPPAAVKPAIDAIPAEAPKAPILTQETPLPVESPMPREATQTMQGANGALPSEVIPDTPLARATAQVPTEVKDSIKDTVKPELDDVSDTSKTADVRETPETVYRGFGRTDDKSVYAGHAVPVAGKGRYYSLSKESAKQYGPEVESASVMEIASKPITIKSDEEWRALTKEAGWKHPNPVGLPKKEIEEMTENLRALVLKKGHDSIIVSFPANYAGDTLPDGTNIKRLRNVFGEPQIVSYKEGPKTPSPTLSETTPPTKKAQKSDTPSVGEGRGVTSDEDSLSLLDEQERGSEFAIRRAASDDEKIVSNLEAVFADLKGVDVEDLKLRFTEEDLMQAQLDYEFMFDSLLDDPARKLIRYRSKSTGRLPEVTGKDTMKSLTGSGKEIKNSEFGKRGDQLLQEIFGYEKQITSSRAQELLDAYLVRRERLMEVAEQLRSIRENIRLAKRKDAFVGLARQTLATQAAKSVKNLRALVEAAELAGFKKGLAQGSKRFNELVARMRARRGKIRAIQQVYNLTDPEMKKIRGAADPRWMDDAEFDEYMKDLETKADYERSRAQERVMIDAIVSEKNLKKAENLQRALELPSIKDMTLDQLRQFSDALAETAPDSTFLGPRMIQTAVNTDLGNIRTIEEGIKRIVEKTGMPYISPVEGSKADEWMRDPALVDKDPLHKMFITEWVAKEADMLTKKFQIQKEVSKLAKAARSSRRIKNAELRASGKLKQTLRERLFARASPQDQLIVRWLQPFETTWDDFGKKTVTRVPEIRVGAERLMTPEELTYARFLENFFSHYYSLAEQEALARWTLQGVKHSRYKDMYFSHMNRSFMERWRDDGFVKALRMAWAKNAEDTKIDFNAFGDRGEVLGYEKWLNRSMTREGEGINKLTGQVTYTQNTAKVALAYFHAFERKLIIDSMTPKIKLLEFLLGARKETPKSISNPDGALQVHSVLTKQINQWINNKKGQRIKFLYEQGDRLESVVDTASILVSLLDLGGNITTQTASGVGGVLFNFRGMPFRGWLRGHKRALSPQGRKIGRENAGIIGESPWDDLGNAAHDLGDNLRSGLFYLFGDLSFRARRQFLLGILTPEEFNTGVIGTKRAAEIKLQIGKWHALPEFRSVLGSTSLAKAASKYTEWAMPAFQTAMTDVRTMIQDLRRVSGDESKIKQLMGSEGFRNTLQTILVGIGAYVAGQIIFSPDDNDRTFMGNLKRKAAREAGSILQAATGIGVFGNVRMLGFMQDLTKAVALIVAMERYETYGPGHKAGDLKGPDALGRALMPNLIDQFIPEPETPLRTEDDIKEEIRMELDAGLIDVSAAKEKYLKDLKTLETARKKRRFKMSEDEYKKDLRGRIERKEVEIKDAKKEFEEYLEEVKKHAPETFESDNEASFITKIQLVAEGMAVDPVTAFEVIFTNEEIRRIDNGSIIVHRGKTEDPQGQRQFSLDERKERGATADLILDHTVPLQLGGTNRDGNLKLVARDQWELYTPVENYLGRLLREEEISDREAQRLIKEFKAGKITAADVYAATE